MRRSAPQGLLLFSLILFQTPQWAETIPVSIRADFEPRRNLLGKTETQDEFSDFVLPEGAQLILKRKSQCSNGIPMTMRPLAALWCEGTKRMSQCMGVDLHTPFFIGRGCRGSECVTDLVPGPSKCLLETLGVNIADANPALDASCGIPPEDALWLEPSPKIASVCFVTIPEVVQQNMWVECSEGELGKFHVSLNFTGNQVNLPTNETYTCQFNICCSPFPETKLLCFTENVPMSDTPLRLEEQNGFQKGNHGCRISLAWAARFTSFVFGLGAFFLLF